MSRKYFNFNNEVDLTPVDVDDETGHVIFTMNDQTAEFDTLEEFAQYYAIARNVKAENLKNWVLTEDGDQFAFVLRAGTAGLDDDEMSQLALGLKNAGMTPEEVGRALAAAVAADGDTAAAIADPEPDAHTEIVTESLKELCDEDEVVLMAACGIKDEDDLIAHFAEDDDWFEYDEEGDDDAWGEEDKDDIRDYSDEEAFNWNIRACIAHEKAELAEAYPGICPVIAASIKLDLATDNDHAKRDLVKANVAAGMAGRGEKVPIKIVICGDENEKPIIEPAFYDHTTKSRLNDYSENRIKYYETGKQFVIALSSDAGKDNELFENDDNADDDNADDDDEIDED